MMVGSKIMMATKDLEVLEAKMASRVQNKSQKMARGMRQGAGVVILPIYSPPLICSG
jgi:hypothetical protein